MAHIHMNVEIWAEAALVPAKEYINGIAAAVLYWGNWVPGLAQQDLDAWAGPC